MIIEVSVVPNSKKFSITLRKGRLRVSLRNPPENNRANIELIKEFSASIGCQVHIISGQNSRKKKLFIQLSPGEWDSFLKTLSEN